MKLGGASRGTAHNEASHCVLAIGGGIATWTPSDHMKEKHIASLLVVALVVIGSLIAPAVAIYYSRHPEPQPSTQPTPDSIRWQHSVDARLMDHAEQLKQLKSSRLQNVDK